MQTYITTAKDPVRGGHKRVTVNAASRAKAAAKLRRTNTRPTSAIRLSNVQLPDRAVTYVA